LALDAPGAFWRRETAPRAAVFIDMADYFVAARSAMLKARRSVHLLNWAFEAATLFDPQPGGTGPDEDRFGPFLKALAADRPEVDVRLLCWDAAAPVAATQGFFPIVDRRAFEGSKVKFRLDSKLPMGACHHQKMIVVDDEVAFCGGGDIGPDRWDTPAHLDDDPRREKTPADNRCFDSRHELMAVVDGPAAQALGTLFRDRWRRCTGEALPQTEPPPGDAWPDGVAPMFRDVPIGISRTIPKWRREDPVREIEQLTLAAIGQARRTIYMENQYFTSPVVAEALAARLLEPDGPEVVLVSTEHSPSYFDQLTMDRTRSKFIERLRAMDRYGRFFVYSPVTQLGRTIIVHAKVTIIDDALLRIGSANMNNRSAGFDTECDLTLLAEGPGEAEIAGAIHGVRTRLTAHWLGCADALVEDLLAQGGLGAAIEALRDSGHCRLRPIPTRPLGPLAALIADFHLGDPATAQDSWRPWRRGKQLRDDIKRLRALPPWSGRQAAQPQPEDCAPHALR
jgi:phosphatidylserine/phosphatidylglycerophosphate/cardiolipin synthase-like enzyme